MIRLTVAAAALLATPALAAPATTLLPVEAKDGRILLTLPAPAADGVAARVLYAASLRSGLGSAPAVLDRGRVGDTQVLAFRRIGGKVALQFENPRFRPAAGGTSPDFAVSTVWMTDIVATQPDGTLVIDLSGFLATDALGVARALGEADPLGVGTRQGGGKNFHIDDKLSAADPASLKAFPKNIEVDALQTYVSDTPGAEVANILPDPRKVTFTVHHSFVALPGPGFTPKPFDVRIGGFATQAVDFAAPLGADVVRDFANRFRLEKTDPAAARSPVKAPIVFYIDRAAPEPVCSALVEGVGWWSRAFEAAGFDNAFRAEPLPDGADPLDVRYNMVTWVDRATRGWSYGQQIVDPRTGEIVKGMVVLGSLRARQDIEIYKGLVGAAAVGKGGPNDPVQVALARLRQLAAHEVGHSLGFAHNFAASLEDRASVMDYPPPRIGIVAGKPDLSDAYGTGIGRWDMATTAWLYGDRNAQDPAQGLRYVSDGEARAPDTAQPRGALWDDGADPVTELTRMMEVRAAALANFGIRSILPGEPMADLRRRFVPIWLLHRYQTVAATKSIGGVDFAYAVAGGSDAAAPPVPAERQRAALAAVLATLSPTALTVPPALVPLLSAPRNGSDNRQYDIEIMATAGGPVFDPLVAADVAASVTLRALLAPARLQRLVTQRAADPQMPGLDEVLDALVTATVRPVSSDTATPLARRIAYRALVTMAQVARDEGTSPDVAFALDAKVRSVATDLGSSDRPATAWSASLGRQLLDPAERERLLADRPRTETVPPGEPIGEDGWMDF